MSSQASVNGVDTEKVAQQQRTQATSAAANDSANTTPPAKIALTGVDIERTDGSIHISGSASNVGGQDAKSVLISVVKTDTVEPAYPGRTYFVGAVPASDFAAFDVYATADANASEISLQIRYLDNGEEKLQNTSLPYEAEPGPETGQSTSISGPLPYVIGGVVILGVVGIMGLSWRNYRSRV